MVRAFHRGRGNTVMIEEPLHLSADEFDQLVADVMDEIPEDWAPLVDTMTVVVEEEPSEDDIPAGAASGVEPLGCYRGSTASAPLIGGGLTGPTATAPPEIALFQGPLERASSSRDDLRRRIHETLVRQVGHHFGPHVGYRPAPRDDDDELGADDSEQGQGSEGASL